MTPPGFQSEQAVQVARAFNAEDVDYLFIGKGGALLLGFPGATQDVDVFADRTPENCRRIVRALAKIGFRPTPSEKKKLLAGEDFVQLDSGPFKLDVIFAPDGIPSFSDAKERSVVIGDAHVANLRDIIASKRASGRGKDFLDLEYMERFRQEYEKAHAPPLRSAAEIATAEKPKNLKKGKR